MKFIATPPPRNPALLHSSLFQWMAWPYIYFPRLKTRNILPPSLSSCPTFKFKVVSLLQSNEPIPFFSMPNFSSQVQVTISYHLDTNTACQTISPSLLLLSLYPSINETRFFCGQKPFNCSLIFFKECLNTLCWPMGPAASSPYFL